MVYVDDLYKMKMGRLGRMKMSHMIADTTEELLSMAEKIGLDKKHIQHKGTPKEHFDVCFSNRNKAVGFGAKEVSYKELATMILNRRIK